MSLRLKCQVAVIACLLVVSCGSGIVKKVEVKPKAHLVGKMQHSQHFANPVSAASAAVLLRRGNEMAWMEASIPENSPVSSSGSSGAVVSSQPSQTTAASISSSIACGGSDYPPCYVAQRESGNTYDAYNPTGCGGSGCYGRWQFSGAWAGKLGLPNDLSQATPEQQDEAARQLWAGGSGCSNWAAC